MTTTPLATAQRASRTTGVVNRLVAALADEPELEFAVLVGSRAAGIAQPTSDWDLALQWSPAFDWLEILGKTETLRRKLAAILSTESVNIESTNIDLIELRRANLTMRANVAEQGLALTGQDSLAWAHFLTRTWRELEDFYWEQRRAA